MKKLDTKTYRLRKLFDYLGVVFLVMLLILIWQLYRGSITVPFLKPYIIKALNHDDTEYQVTLDSVNLELVRSIRPLRIIANNVVYRKADGTVAVNAPKTSVSFSIKALLHGIIAPSSVDVYKPRVYIFTTYGVDKNKKENVNQKKLEYYFDGFEDFLERFNSEDQSYPESYINDISITGAEVEFHEVDLGKKWVLSDVNYRFDRGFTKLETEVNALLKFNDIPSSLGLEAVYRGSDDKLALRFYFADLVPANLIELITSENKAENYKIDLPLNGSIDALVDLKEIVKKRADLVDSLDTAVEAIRFAIEGGQGHIAFSDNAEENYNIGALTFNGTISGGLDKLSIEGAELELDGQKAVLGLEASGMKNYLLNSSLKDLKLTLSAGVKKLATDDLFRYWPQHIAAKAWKWCKESLSEGTIEDADFKFHFGYDRKQQKFVFRDLSGTASASGISLDYLTGMPKVTDVYGRIDFAADKLKMYFDKGVSDDVILDNGYVELYDLNQEDNFAKIDLSGVGSISDILRLIDHKPLQYTSEMGIDPDSIKGSAETNLKLAFELKQDLEPDEVTVDITAALHDVRISGMVKDKTIEAKKLDLSVTNQGMLVDGVANFEGIPVTLKWNESFNRKDYQSRYQLSFNFDHNLKQKLGLDFDALGDAYIQGAIPAQATITTYAGDKMVIDVNGDLRGANIDYSFLGFKKKSGVEGVISARINFLKDKIRDIPLFALSKPDFNIKGKIAFDSGSRIKTIDITDIKGPKISARAKIDMVYAPKEKVKINVSGSSYNLSDFFSKDEAEIKASKERRKLKKMRDATVPETEDKNEWANVADTDINIAVNSLWTNKDVAIRNFAGSAKIIHGIGINEMHLIGNFASSRKKSRPASLKLDYVPRPHKEYLLTIESNDAGSTMKFLRFYDYMRGGTLSVSAKRDADKNFVGHAKIRNFNIHNTPVFAKLLTVASFTGMVNLLTGEGIAFSHFDAPFEYKHSVLKINEGKAFGNVVGITGSGTYSTRYQEFNIRGLIAPAYGLNTFIGSIPLVGTLLSGKDGTVFAANYSITGDIDDPNISINPLSALSPNSLKELFSSVFGKNNDR